MIDKKLVPFIIFFATLALAVPIACSKHSNPPPVTKDTTVNLKKGLLLYLPFDGNIADSSGNNNPTQAVGNVLTYDMHGYPNNAFGATGNGEKIYVTNNGSIQFDTAYSVSFTFMVNAAAQQGYISMVDPATGRGPTFLVGTTFVGINSFGLGSEDISLGCDNYGTQDSVNLNDTTAFTPVPGSWYNSVFIYHKGALQTYINGILISSKTGKGTKALLCPASKIIIGAWWDGDALSLNGKLDNIRLYNRVLNTQEIAALSSNYQVTSNSQKPAVQTH